MKKLIFLLLTCSLSLHLYAQIRLPKTLKLSSAARRIRSGRLLPRPSVPRLSQQSNLALERKLLQISQVKRSSPADKTIYKHPAPTTFQVQYKDGVYQGTASAFAIKLRGQTWGVVANHVRKSMLPKPYIRIKSDPHTFHIAPIERFYRGNSDAMDVALFEIPQEVAAFVHPLEPAEHPSLVGQEVNIPGFTKGQEVYLPQERILFGTSMRMFIQKTTDQDLNGFCGAPILDQFGKVQAVYAGFLHPNKLHQYDWFMSLPHDVRVEMPALHYAIPVQILDILAKGAQEHSMQKTGQIMKAFGKPLALLHPEESIVMVQQYRNGKKIAQLEANPLLDPEQLELTFEWEENDVLRVVIRRPQTDVFMMPHIGYDLNVSTGKVTELAEKDIELFN